MNNDKLNVEKLEINLEKSVIDSIIRDYESSIRYRLLNGEKVTIEGVGTLSVSYRKVKNDAGRDYSLRVKVKQDRKFAKEIVEEYNKSPNKFRS